MKTKLTTSLCAFLLFQMAYAQNSSPIQQAQVWLQPDLQNTDSVFFRDLTQNSHHAFPLNQAAQPAVSLLNFNPCFLVTEDLSPFVLHYNIGTAGKMTVMAVFQALDTLEESGVWEIKKDTTFYQLLTTRRIQGSALKFKYRNDYDTSSLVNTFMFAWKDSNTDSVPDDVTIGGTDSIRFKGKIAEFILFEDYLNQTNLQKYQSYLCIKYGITLRMADYVNSIGDTLWNREENLAYGLGVFGLGRDTVFGLNQKQSLSTSIHDIITLGAGSLAATNDQNTFTLNQGDYLLCGSNGETATIAWQDSLQTAGLLQRQWLMQLSGNTCHDISTSLRVNLTGILTDSMLCFLVIAPNALPVLPYSDLLYFLPDSITPDKVACFNNLYWDTDQSGRDVFSFFFVKEQPLFANNPSLTGNLPVRQDDTPLFPFIINPARSFQPDSNLQQALQPSGGSSGSASSGNPVTCSLYPNPTAGSFDLIVTAARPACMSLRIIDAAGNLIQMSEAGNQSQYHYKGTIMVAGKYYLDIRMEGNHRMIPLIVK